MPKLDIIFTVPDIVNFIPGHVYWLNRDGVYLGCNDQQAKSAGLASSNEIVGKRNVDFPWVASAEILDATNELVMTTGKTIVLEEVATLFDGTKATFVSTKSPLFDNTGDVIGLIGNSIKISNHKCIEDELISDNNSSSLTGLITDQNEFCMIPPVLPVSSAKGKICYQSLTVRERECAYCLLKGATAKEIGRILHISVRTVDSHIENMKNKLLCYSKSQLVRKLFFLSNMFDSE